MPLAQAGLESEARKMASVATRLLQIEINEFSVDLLKHGAEKLNLARVKQLLSLPRVGLKTDDLIEHQGLDPWVQWPSVHMGAPSSRHGVKRLGDTKNQSLPQIWTSLGEAGLTWAAWGVMNAPAGDLARCAFFMPDPWSFEEDAHPSELNDLLAYPRYMSKNYIAPNAAGNSSLLRTLAYLARPSNVLHSARLSAGVARALAGPGVTIHSLATLLDLLGVSIFVDLKRRHDPNFSVIFINTIAHLQHHFWHASGAMHKEMEFGLRILDEMLDLLFSSAADDEAILVVNGLCQTNVEGQGFFVYRQLEPASVLAALGVQNGIVEQCMTHDAHIIFDSIADAENAIRVLDDARLSDGTKAFFVERLNPLRVFYQINFEHDVPSDTSLIVGERHEPFYKLFAKVCERTGAHVPRGDLFYKGISVPGEMHNHQLFDVVAQHFSSAKSHVRRATAA
jgi:hypothetical protein